MKYAKLILILIKQLVVHLFDVLLMLEMRLSIKCCRSYRIYRVDMKNK